MTRTRIWRVNVDPVTNALTQVDALGTTPTVKRKIIGVLAETQESCRLALSVGNDMLIDMTTDLFSTAVGFVPVSIPLEVGDNVKVGFYAGGTFAAKDILLMYEEIT